MSEDYWANLAQVAATLVVALVVEVRLIQRTWTAKTARSVRAVQSTVWAATLVGLSVSISISLSGMSGGEITPLGEAVAQGALAFAVPLLALTPAIDALAYGNAEFVARLGAVRFDHRRQVRRINRRFKRLLGTVSDQRRTVFDLLRRAEERHKNSQEMLRIARAHPASPEVRDTAVAELEDYVAQSSWAIEEARQVWRELLQRELEYRRESRTVRQMLRETLRTHSRIESERILKAMRGDAPKTFPVDSMAPDDGGFFAPNSDAEVTQPGSPG